MKQGGVEQIDHLLRAGRIAEALDAPLLEQAAGVSRDRLRNLFEPKRQTGAADTVGTSALTFGDLLYDAAAVDPTVIEATDFSSADSVENIFSFAFKAKDGLDGAAQQVEGRLIRLRGYVGERVAAMSLRHDGKEVAFPANASQPAYDLMVDEQPFQVKCGSDVDVIEEHFLMYPNTPVIANVELADQVDSLPEAMRDQVYFQQGFSVHEVDVITRESVDAGEEMLDFEIPWVALAMAGARTFLRYRAGGTTLSNAVARCAAEWAARSALGTAVAPLGQVAGLILFGPAGGVVLGGVGAVVGVSLGHKVVDIGAQLIARGEKRAAAGAVRELVEAGARALDRKVHAFTQRRVTTEQALTARRPPAAVAALFRKRLDREVRDHDHSRNELRYYAAKVEALGSGPMHWATRSFDLLHRAAVLPYSVQAETGKVLEMVDAYRRRLKNPLPDLDSLVAAVRPT